MCQTNKTCDVENGNQITDIIPNKQNDTPPSTKKGIYMDEALTKTNFGLFNYIMIFLSGVILNAVLMETCGVSFVIPVSQCDLKLTAGEKGILNAVAFFGIICSSHLWGYLSDTKGRRTIIQPTLFIAFALSCTSSLVQNFYVFVTLRFLNGFFISGPAATVYAYLSEFHDNVQRARAIMGSAIIFGISCLLLPVIASIVINQEWEFDIPVIDITFKPWRLFLIVCSLPGLFVAISLTFLPESPKFVLGQGDQDGAYKILQKMNRINNGKKAAFEEFEIFEEPESIANRERILKSKESRFPLLTSIWIQTAPLFQRPHLFSTVLICTIQFGIYTTSNGFYMFVPEILNVMANNLDSFIDQRMSMCEVINMKPMNTTIYELDKMPDDVCATRLELETIQQEIILESLYAAGFVVIGILINRVGKFPILFFLLSVCGTGGFLCMLVDIPLVQICSFIALMCCGMAVNVVNAATVDLYPTASRGMAVCISLMFGRLGCVVGANIAALLLNNHCELVFYLSGSCMLAMAVLTFFIPNIHTRIKIKKDVEAPTEPNANAVTAK